MTAFAGSLRRSGLGVILGVLIVLFWALRVAWPIRPLDLTTTDIFTYFYPYYRTVYSQLLPRQLPLWNPYILCGIPWIGTTQAGFFYPPHLVYLLLPTSAALASSAVLHLLLAAFSMALFAGEAGATAEAAFLAALLFTVRGTFIHWLLWPDMLEAAAWLPVGSLAVLKLARGATARGVALLGLATGASVLAGYPQVTVYLVYGWSSLLAVACLVSAPLRRWPRITGAFAAALCLGALIGAIQIVPGLELARAGTRAAHQLTPQEMFTAVNPSLDARLLTRMVLPGSQFSFGLVGLSLAAGAVFLASDRPLALWALGLGLVSFVLAFGPSSPFFVLYRTLPLLGWFRLPNRILLLTDFSFALLSALTFDAITGRTASTSTRPGQRRVRLATVSSLGALALIGLLAVRDRQTATERSHLLLVSVPLVAIAFMTFAWERGRAARPAAAVLLLVIAALEPFAARSTPIPFPYTSRAEDSFGKYQAAFERLRERAGAERVWLYGSALPPLEFAPTLAPFYGLRSMDGYEPSNLRRQAEFFTYLAQGSIKPIRPPWLFLGRVLDLDQPDGIASHRRLMDIAAVRFVVMPQDVATRREVREFVRTAGLTPSSTDTLAVFENERALPRAFVTYRTASAPSSERVLEAMSDGSFDPLVESYVEGDPGFSPAIDAPPRGQEATIVRDDANVVEVKAELKAAGLLVLADSFYPGWYASVDGRRAPIVPANHLFRGVPTSAGTHIVRFEYRPVSVALGGAVSAAGVLSLAVLLWIGARKL